MQMVWMLAVKINYWIQYSCSFWQIFGNFSLSRLPRNNAFLLYNPITKIGDL